MINFVSTLLPGLLTHLKEKSLGTKLYFSVICFQMKYVVSTFCDVYGGRNKGDYGNNA